MAAWVACQCCERYLVRVEDGVVPPSILCSDCLPDSDASTTQAALGLLMTWWNDHYANPADVCPFESADGGFQWIWGGPYDAYEEVLTHWGKVFTNEMLLLMVGHLQAATGVMEWSGVIEGQQEVSHGG